MAVAPNGRKGNSVHDAQIRINLLLASLNLLCVLFFTTRKIRSTAETGGVCGRIYCTTANTDDLCPVVVVRGCRIVRHDEFGDGSIRDKCDNDSPRG